jgi:transcriptional regulator with XRE-family HTH domain
MSSDGGEAVAAVIGRRVRSLRRARSLTVTEVAERSGVSRRSWTDLEAGRANASLSTLDRVAAALEVAFVDLVQPAPRLALEVVAREGGTVLWAGRNRSQARLLTSTAVRGQAELWDGELSPGDRYDAGADPDGSEEMVAVVVGVLTVELGTESHEVEAGGAIRFSSNRPYSFCNRSDRSVHFVRTVVIHR